MSQKHTQGDWTEPRVYKKPDGAIYACRVYANGRTICDINTKNPNWRANGRVIGAASGLLTAAEEMLKMISFPMTNKERIAYEKLHKAVIKAKGLQT